ncbi:GNAT family N-acetyltransferase [Telmatobacter sp. DSM 110680]|uniref:GNAT family N-acetyltransferase n=1 Tax=Telmatobacter sp. DSM 110680 TaxID=3036704 RepID=A0AAU7DE97_9BACT
MALITIERITPETALVLKDVRLRALLDSLTAFSSTYAKESLFPDEEWRKRAVRWSSNGSAIFLAMEGDAVCGIIGAYEEVEQCAQVISMWVAPEARRAGVGMKLVEAVADWAQSRGMRELKLMVTSVNDVAIAFYQRMGFAMTGKTGVYPNDAAITEFEMVRRLV